MTAKNPRQRRRQSAQTLRVEYDRRAALAAKLAECLFEQVATLFRQNDLTLGVPLETRVKEWDSIQGKIDRKSLFLSSIDELNDLVGLRAILLFRRDLSKADKIIRDNFEVISSEDVSERLETTQFGYQSQHYVVKLLESWTSIPSYSDLGSLKSEIQVRTVAQHIWAAASHKLQYKREESVPPPLRRTIHRVSALLETVDLEFSRVLEERDTYLEADIHAESSVSSLNVDSLQKVLGGIFPAENKSNMEFYDDLLRELEELGVSNTEQLQEILSKNRSAAIKKDKEYVAEYSKQTELTGTMKEKVSKGVFMSFTGLARWALRAHFGEQKVDGVMEKVAGHGK